MHCLPLFQNFSGYALFPTKGSSAPLPPPPAVGPRALHALHMGDQWTNLKVGAPVRSESGGGGADAAQSARKIFFWSCSSTFWL